MAKAVQTCEQCSKKYKTKGGLKLRYKRDSIDVIYNNKIHERHNVKEVFEKACKKVLEEKLHSVIVINEVEMYLDLIKENDITDLQNQLLTLSFHEKELYYYIILYYHILLLFASKTYLKDLTENTSKVILMKLANSLQVDLKETKDIDKIHTKSLNEKEAALLQYLGEYVISNLYRKPKKLKNYQSEECQQALSLLSACKSDVEINRNTNLVSAT